MSAEGAPFWKAAKGLVAPRHWGTFRGMIEAVGQSRAPATVKQYAYQVRAFQAFCGEGGYRHLPAPPLVVALYLHSVAATATSYAAVKSASAAISTYHEMNGDASNPTKNLLCKMVRLAAKRRLGVEVKRRKAPLVPAEVERLVAGLAPAGAPLQDVMLAAFAATAFAGFLRYSDAVQLRVSDLRFGAGYVELSLAKRKNDQFRAGSVVALAELGGDACPVAALRRLLRVSGWGPDSLLFRAWDGQAVRAGRPAVFKDRAVQYGQLHYQLTKRMAAILGVSHAAAKARFGTHSFRAGGATAAYAAGVDMTLLQAHGSWKTAAAMHNYIDMPVEQRLGVSRALGGRKYGGK